MLILFCAAKRPCPSKIYVSAESNSWRAARSRSFLHDGSRLRWGEAGAAQKVLQSSNSKGVGKTCGSHRNRDHVGKSLVRNLTCSNPSCVMSPPVAPAVKATCSGRGLRLASKRSDRVCRPTNERTRARLEVQYLDVWSWSRGLEDRR